MPNVESILRKPETPGAPAPLLRRFTPLPPRILLIGASTGGPQALGKVLHDASGWLRQIPIVVVLHAPPDYIHLVAAGVAGQSRMPARVALNGEALAPGIIYFAPGDRHLRVMTANDRKILVHSDAEAQNSCKPAVDVLFRSGARTFGPEALGLVLTGMGRDGLKGAEDIVEAGGNVIVQDEATSAVWGMPGSIARRGLASAILPLDSIASAIGGLLVSSRRTVRA